MAAAARAALGTGDEVVEVTNTRGPPVVRSAAMLAEAEAAIPGLMAPHVPHCDAFVLGISLDSAIDRLRPAWGGKPALGMTEAGVLLASRHGTRIGLLTLGRTLVPLYDARLAMLLPPERRAGVAAGELERAFDPGIGVDDGVLQVLVDAAATLAADAYVLAGAVLCGYDQALQARLRLPVFDGVGAASRLVHGPTAD